ncbi:MAG: hypothetical protein ACKO4Z_06780 [Planctomycetota bacterium]
MAKWIGHEGEGEVEPEAPSPAAAPQSPAWSPGSGIFGLLVAVGVIAAFHGFFMVPFERMLHEKWLKFPAAIMITLAHVTLGSIGSVWLSRIVPRLLRSPYTHGWCSATTASFLLSVVASAWLGYRTFDLIPNWQAMTGLNFGLIGLFLVIPASMYFWQWGRFLSW